MAVLKTEGIILKKYELRETSYILVVYTRDFGKVTGVIKGVRNPSPQFAGDLERFTKCEILFYKKKKKGLDLISGCRAIETYLPIRKEIERLTYADYFIELIDIVTDDYCPDKKLYDIFSGSLGMLATKASAKRTGRIFEIKILEAIGLEPQLEECSECGVSMESVSRFNVKSGGAVCSSCVKTGIKVSMGTINFMKKIGRTSIEKSAAVKVSKEVGKEAEIVLREFIKYHINRPIKSTKFLRQLELEKIIT
ncbi:MAG: DNA repair protein RecO [Candidatus Aadella gelida]|nr:DNA repair protein RecO [Candidatus Aadella gelida]